MAGRKSKRKGYRIEKLCTDWLNEMGRESGVPVVAARGDGHVGRDVISTIGNGRFTWECKGRRTGEGFKTLLQWIVGSDALFLHADNQPSLIALKPNALRSMIEEAYAAGQVAGLRLNGTTTVYVHTKGDEIVEVGGQPITKVEDTTHPGGANP